MQTQDLDTRRKIIIMLGYIGYGWTAVLFTLIKMRSVVVVVVEEEEEAAC
jgi:heme exporter protein D